MNLSLSERALFRMDSDFDVGILAICAIGYYRYLFVSLFGLTIGLFRIIN